MLTAGYDHWINQPEQKALRERIRAELRGKTLACWCPLDHDCHGDILLEIANEGSK